MIPAHRTRRARRGLSILDVMVSVGIVLMLALFAAVAIQNAAKLNEVMKNQDRAFRTPLLTVRRQLQLAFLTPSITAAERYRTVFVGTDGEPDSLWFTTRGHQRRYRHGHYQQHAAGAAFSRRSGGIDQGYLWRHHQNVH